VIDLVCFIFCCSQEEEDARRAEGEAVMEGYKRRGTRVHRRGEWSLRWRVGLGDLKYSGIIGSSGISGKAGV